MGRRWSIAPLAVWFLGVFTSTTPWSSTHVATVVSAFTPIPPASTTSFSMTQQLQQQPQSIVSHPTSSVDILNQHVSSTSLEGTASSMMSPWNINPEFGAPPFGFDMNAEIWNGRIAQVSFVWVFLQEFVQGKGVIQGLSDGDMINVISFSVFAVTIIALIGRFLAEPPAGWPTREVSISSPPYSNVMSPIKSNPMAYAQAKSVEKLTKTITATNSDKTILNFNDGSSPFGFKKNAEVWNGRIAMIAFVWAFVQEFFQREGFFSAMERSDGIAMTSFWCAVTAMFGFTGVISSMGEDDGYVERVVGIDALRKNARDSGWQPPVEPAYQTIQVTSVVPGTGVSEPITYERYMNERSRLAKDDFASSLKAMSAEPRPKPATAVASSWTTSIRKPPTTWSDTASAAENSYWMTANGKSMTSWSSDSSTTGGTQPYGAAYNPITIKAGTSVTIEGTNLHQSAKLAPTMSYAETLKAMTSDVTDKSKMSLPYGTAYMPVAVKPGTLAEIASPGASRHLDQYDSSTAFFSVTNTVVPNKVAKDDKSPHPDGVFEFKSSMKRAIFDKEGKPITYVVEGYRFKPETKSLIHPDGVFKFEPDTRKIVKLSDRESPKSIQPKSKPITYPVAGFRFDDTTKTVIQREKIRGSTLASPPPSSSSAMSSSPPPLKQNEDVQASILSPGPSNVVNVISDGTSMNNPPIGAAVSNAYKAMGSSYLEALNRESSSLSEQLSYTQQSSSPDDELIVKPIAPPTKTGLSYLETLGR